MLSCGLGEGSHWRWCQCWLISPYRSWHRSACVTCHKAPMCLFITAWEVCVCVCLQVCVCLGSALYWHHVQFYVHHGAFAYVCINITVETMRSLFVWMCVLAFESINKCFVGVYVCTRRCMCVCFLYILLLLHVCVCLPHAYLCVFLCVRQAAPTCKQDGDAW